MHGRKHNPMQDTQTIIYYLVKSWGEEGRKTKNIFHELSASLKTS